MKPPAGVLLFFGAFVDFVRIKHRVNGSHLPMRKGVDDIDCLISLMKARTFSFRAVLLGSAAISIGTLIAPLATAGAPLLAEDSPKGPLKGYVTTYSSSKPVEELVGHLRNNFLGNKFLIKGIIDHQEIALSQGIKIPKNTALLVGLPSFEAPIIKANPLGSLFIPLVIAVWRDNEKTNVSYWNPSTDFGDNLEIKDNNEAMRAIDKMQKSLKKIVTSAL